METNQTPTPSPVLVNTTAAPTVRCVQVFVSPTTDPDLAAAALAGPATVVQLIPVSPAALPPAHALAEVLRRAAHRVEITLPLRDGTDLTGAASILRV